MAVGIKVCAGTTAQWQAVRGRLILDERELGVEITESGYVIRMGDGESDFFDLPKIADGARYEQIAVSVAERAAQAATSAQEAASNVDAAAEEAAAARSAREEALSAKTAAETAKFTAIEARDEARAAQEAAEGAAESAASETRAYLEGIAEAAGDYEAGAEAAARQAELYAKDALSATPEGFSEVAQKVNRIALATSEDIAAAIEEINGGGQG